ncbi:OprO/OprP family phosphate-selective porin [Pseudomonadota bacterium]
MPRILTLIIFLLVSSLPAPASAGTRTMLKLLAVLYDNRTIDEQTFEMLVAAAREEEGGLPPAGDQGGQPPDAAATGSNEKPEAPSVESADAVVEYDGSGLRVSSADGKYQSAFNGYLQVDAARYNETSVPMGDGAEIRRARLTWRGKIADSWLFRTTLDFSDGASIKSTYIDYMFTPSSSIRFGNFKVPFSVDWLTSGRYTTFMERAMVTALAPGRNFGIGYNTEGDHHSLKLGIFSDAADDDSDAGQGVAGRVTYAPWAEKTSVLHLGLAASYRNLQPGNTERFRSRPESHVTDVRLVDTGELTDGERISRVGLEAAALKGPFSVQSEYIRTDLERGERPELNFEGWYAYASWVLTGESREYDVGNGRFRRIRPAHPLGQGGSGAWELALRYSNLDLNDEDVVGGEQDNITLALNWYPNKDVRFSLNYINIVGVDRPGSETDGERGNILQIRGQVQF